jgi:hypothetical protein
MNSSEIDTAVKEALDTTRFIDVHTHLFAPDFGKLALWGIDELLTYHYLVAEFFRFSPIHPDDYWKLDKQQRADAIWQTLFVQNTPISEATRGVIAVLEAFGLDPNANSLVSFRKFFREQKFESHMRRVFDLSGVSDVVMTNDPMDPVETQMWDAGAGTERGFHAALRLDQILNASGPTPFEGRRQLEAMALRMKPVYMAVSLPDTFVFPTDDLRTALFREAVLPACKALDVPLALMIGVRRGVNPALRSGGDGSGRADLRAVENLCLEFPDNRFLVTVLSRENQHELCVCARKFSNLLPFGCWWFMNNPSIVEEITRERLEMLGTSFIPQHSDARVLEQLIYKWRNTRRTMAPILSDTYTLLEHDGRAVTREDIKRDVDRLFRSNFQRWTQRRAD